MEKSAFYRSEILGQKTALSECVTIRACGDFRKPLVFFKEATAPNRWLPDKKRALKALNILVELRGFEPLTF